jgi:hypothetical protein
MDGLLSEVYNVPVMFWFSFPGRVNGDGVLSPLENGEPLGPFRVVTFREWRWCGRSE